MLHHLTKWENFPSLYFLLLSWLNSSPKHPSPKKAVYQRLPEVHRGIRLKPKSHYSTQNLLTGSVAMLFAAVFWRTKAAKEKQSDLGNQIPPSCDETSFECSWIMLKFPQNNTLLWRATELRGINVRVPSGYLCDFTLLDCQELNQRMLLRQKPNDHKHTPPPTKKDIFF